MVSHTTTTTTLICGGCGLALLPATSLPAECPHCGERVSIPPRIMREAELEDRARRGCPAHGLSVKAGQDPRRSTPR